MANVFLFIIWNDVPLICFLGSLNQYPDIQVYIEGLLQDCSNSSALAIELLQSCTKPSIFMCQNLWPATWMEFKLRDHCGYGLSQWEVLLYHVYNTFFHWPSPYTEWSLIPFPIYNSLTSNFLHHNWNFNSNNILTHWGCNKIAAILQTTFSKCTFLKENVLISIKISLKLIPKGPINNILALAQIMAWHRPDDKPLSEPMTIILLTHICVTRPQWVNNL